MVLIPRARGIERAATAVRSSPGMSVQQDIPISVMTPSPLLDDVFLEGFNYPP